MFKDICGRCAFSKCCTYIERSLTGSSNYVEPGLVDVEPCKEISDKNGTGF